MPRPPDGGRSRRSAAAAALLLAAGAGLFAVEASAAPADSTHAAPAHPPSAALPVPRAAEWETLSTGLPEEARFRRLVGFRYNRVDGPALTLGGAFQNERAAAPLVYAQGTYAFSRERPLFEGGFEVPLHERPGFLLGAAYYRKTASEDEWIVAESENTIFALLARTDYRDYYESQGGRAYLEVEPGSDFALRAGFRSETQASLSTRTRVSLTGKEPVFRPNPPILDGSEQALTLESRIGPAEIPARGGTQGELLYERSGEPLQGDFEYGRMRAVVRSKSRLSPREDFRVRMIAGSTLSGSLPPQKVWHVGGIGTLRGHDYKAFSGDQFFLVNAEFARRLRKVLHGFAFLDYGAAWFGRGNLGRQKPEPDGGVGLRIGDGQVAVTVAKNLRVSDSKPRVGVRLGGNF